MLDKNSEYWRNYKKQVSKNAKMFNPDPIRITWPVLPELRKGPSILVSSFQSTVFHTRTVLSVLCEAKYEPTGSQVTPLTKFSWPFKTATRSNLSLLFHTTIVLSNEAEARYLSFRFQARSITSDSCVCSLFFQFKIVFKNIFPKFDENFWTCKTGNQR